MSRGRGRGKRGRFALPRPWRLARLCLVTGPDGIRRRKYIKATTYEAAQAAWLKLRAKAESGPVASNLPKLTEFMAYWLREVVKLNLAPKTYEKYEMFTRLYVVPYLGDKRLDKLTPRDVRTWLNQLRDTCQCCAQDKDANRPEAKRRCCAIGKCCRQVASMRTCRDARDTLRAALTHAVTEDELISRNVAVLVRLPSGRTRKVRARAWVLTSLTWSS